MDTTRPKALVVYESIFGNTQAVAEAVGRGLAGRYDVEVVEVSRAPTSPTGLALLVVGGPIHAFGMTREATRTDARKLAYEKGREVVSPGPGVREWLARLAQAEPGVAAAAFDTAGKLGWFVVGSAARGEAAELRTHGYDVVAKPEHFIVTDIDGPMRPGEVERAEAWGKAVGEAAQGPRRAADAGSEVETGVAHLRLLT